MKDRRSIARMSRQAAARFADVGRELFDVCIVGSGPAGAVVGIELVRRGVRVLMIESGGAPGDVSRDRRLRELEVYRSSGGVEYPVVATRTRALGGTSDSWIGRCTRLHPLDFEPNAYTPERAPWPIRYADLEPFYVRAEQTLRVRGGTSSEHFPPRSRPLSLPPRLSISGLRAMAGRAGITVEDSPTSTGRAGRGPIRVARDLLPEVARSPNGSLVSGATVTRLLVDGRGAIDGAEVRSLDGAKQTARARFYVLACGAIETPRLLLLSASPESPTGIGNRHDRVGRTFMEHPTYPFYGKINHTWNTVWPMYELARSHQFYDSFKRRGLGAVDLVWIQSWVFPDEVKAARAGRFGEAIRGLLGRIRKADLLIAAQLELRPSDDNRVILSRDVADRFGNPAADVSLSITEDDRRTRAGATSLVREIFGKIGATGVVESWMRWGHHQMGTCRMGDDPATSVVDRDLRVHECSNLYVAGSATFVTGGASNPTLTIAALSHRLADHLIERLRSV